ncbi:MAG: hypothetical protein B7C54_06795 [Acidimicrobiales bacterium mtb01]|nr:zinc ribbon domain-containing protein [Actinomycetota bacterium]TEX44857.1 MAG: hypothetical protein B7C54_06795 [Acidimicrobiales bacterium mtb01]
MKCGLCWADNPDDALFCVDCGVMLTAQSVANVPTIDQVDPAGHVGGNSRNRGLVAVSLLAIVSTLALLVLVIVLAIDDGEPAAAPTTPAPATTVATTTTAPVDQLRLASDAWRGFSAAFLQPHLDEPFVSGDRILAIASADDLAARPSQSIAGLVLLGWSNGQWTSVDGIPFQSPDTAVAFEVLGSRLVANPMVVITWSGSDDGAVSYVFRAFDDELVDIVSGRPIGDEWTAIAITDRSFDFVEYTACKTGEVLSLADGSESFFCDVVVDSRIDILDDGTTRKTEVETAQTRPELVFPNDLEITGVRMTQPECDGSYITAVGASVSSSETRNRANIAKLLKRYPGSSYLRNDQTCDSLWPEADGAPIYIVYFGPYATKSEACDARDLGPKGAYVRPLDDDVPYTKNVYC